MPDERKAIGVVAPQLSGIYFGTLLDGISSVIDSYTTHLIAFQGTPADLATSRMARSCIVGWIVINTMEGIDALATSGVPLVAIGAVPPAGVDCPAVFPDNHGGMQAAVTHLIGHGHARIAFVGDMQNADIRQRHEGYTAALEAHGITPDPRLLISVADNSEERGAQSLRRLVEMDLGCTAVAAATDETAMGILRAAPAVGRSIPEDLAVVSFDDIILASSTMPPLTTVRLPIRALGVRAAELLLDRLEGRSVEAGISHVVTALITRRSCGCRAGRMLPANAAPFSAEWRTELAQQLAMLITYPLPVDDTVVLGEVWPEGEALIDALQKAISGADDDEITPVYDVWQSAVTHTDNLETLLTIVRALEQAGMEQAAQQGDAASARARVAAFVELGRLDLIRARMTPESNFVRTYSAFVQQNHEISMQLLRAQMGAARRLDWLAQTTLRSGLLGLWTTSDRSAKLTIAGVFTRGAVPLVTVGNTLGAADFPPAELTSGDESAIAIVLPIRSEARDWGLLALAGPIRYLMAAGNFDVLTALSTLLAGALDRDNLQQALHDVYERERVLSDVVREIGSPVIPLLPGVLLVPIVGLIDQDRAQQITEAILTGVSEEHANQVLIDITGVPMIDTQVANALIQAAQAIRLLGARAMLVGIRPEIAQSIVGLGVDLRGITTLPTLAAALRALLSASPGKVRGIDDRS